MYRRNITRHRESRLDSTGEEHDIDMVHSDIPHIEFISKFSSLPVVNSALVFATDAYGKAKNSSPNLIKKTLDTAEGTVKYAANRAAPVMNTFGGPIHLVDSLACKTLDKVQGVLPIVTREPNEIVNDTRNYVSEKLQPVQSGVNFVVKTVDKALDNPFGGLVINTAVGAVSTVEDNVNHYLPPAEDEPSSGEEPVGGEPTKRVSWCLQHAAGIAGTIWRRTWKRSQHFLFGQSLYFFISLSAIFTVMEWVQGNWKDVRMTEIPSKYREFYQDVSNRMSREGPTQQSSSLQREFVDRIKRLVTRSFGTATRIPLYFLGKGRDQVESTLNMWTNMTTRLTKMTRMDRVAISALATFQQQLPLVFHLISDSATTAADVVKRVFPNWNLDIDAILQAVDAKVNEGRQETKED